MKHFLQRMIAKILQSSFVLNNPHIGYERWIRTIEKIKAREQLEQVTLGSQTRLHVQASIHNFQKDPKKILIGAYTQVRGQLLIFAHNGHIDIGDYCYIGENTYIWSAAYISIGKGVLISHNCNIIDTNSHEIDYIKRVESYKKMLEKGHSKEPSEVATQPITIDDYAWISYNVSILKGVSIGKGAIISAGSVVTKDVAPFTMVAGNPAKFIKNITPNEGASNPVL